MKEMYAVGANYLIHYRNRSDSQVNIGKLYHMTKYLKVKGDNFVVASELLFIFNGLLGLVDTQTSSRF